MAENNRNSKNYQLSPESRDKVTLRKQYKVNVNIENSYESLSVNEDDEHNEYSSFTSIDDHNRSCPHLQCNEKEKLEELQILVKMLQEKVASAENEIENLLTENCYLKKIISNNEKNINNLKKICYSTPKKCSIHKRKSINMSKLHYSEEEKYQEDSSTTSNTRTSYENPQCQFKLKPETQHTHTESNVSNILLPHNSTLQIQNIQVPSMKIIIIGGTQCRDLASKLIHSRNNSKYDKYNIQSLIYPEASTEVLTQTCETLQLDEHDKLVLCIGEDSTDPQRLSHELYYILKKIRASIILLSIRKSKYLNETKLNHLINCVSNKFEYCNFIQTKNFHNDSYYIKNICYNINLVVDTIDYNNKFIPKNGKLICRVHAQKENDRFTSKKLRSRQKTITEYFPFVRANQTKSVNNKLRSNILNNDIRKVNNMFFRL